MILRSKVRDFIKENTALVVFYGLFLIYYLWCVGYVVNHPRFGMSFPSNQFLDWKFESLSLFSFASEDLKWFFTFLLFHIKYIFLIICWIFWSFLIAPLVAVIFFGLTSALFLPIMVVASIFIPLFGWVSENWLISGLLYCLFGLLLGFYSFIRRPDRDWKNFRGDILQGLIHIFFRIPIICSVFLLLGFLVFWLI